MPKKKSEKRGGLHSSRAFSSWGLASLITAVVAALLASCIAWPRAPEAEFSIREDAYAVEQLRTSLKALHEAKGTSQERQLWFDYIQTLAKFRHLDEAFEQMQDFLGSDAPAHPIISVTYAELLESRARRGSGETAKEMRQDSLALVRTAKRAIRSRLKAAQVHPGEKASLGWLLGSLRPYHFLTAVAGAPVPPFKDDGIKASRQQNAVHKNSGFGGKLSNFSSSAQCTIDRRDWTKLSQSEYIKEYYEQGRPVILFGKGLVETTGGDWTVADLHKRFGNVSLVAPKGSGTLFGKANEMPTSTTLSDYINLVMGHDSTEYAGNSEVKYSFGESDIPEELLADIKRPSHFQDVRHFAQQGQPNLQRLFSLGPTNAYTYFHQHGDAYFTLVHGEKLFVMYPFGAEVGMGHRQQANEEEMKGTEGLLHNNMLKWYTDIRRKLATHPAECILKGGEIIYVPCGWRHAVINIRDSVGMAFQNM
jgi:hypothetical protein